MQMLTYTLKGGLVLSFLIFTCICCAPSTTETKKTINSSETNKAASPNVETTVTSPAAPPPYDTIIINLDASYHSTLQRDKQYATLSTQALIDSLISLASKESVISYNDDQELFDGFDEAGKYYNPNIPISLYKKLFPKEEVETSVERIRELSTDEAKKVVYLEQGRKIEEERKYKNLYAANDKIEYLQLFFTTQGKYSPAVTLLTFTKEELKLIDQLELYGGIYDSYDIDYWHSQFDENYDGVEVTRVKNLKFDDIDLDTTVVNYAIRSNGEIIQGN